MRVIIIGLDGLEATFINPRHYPNLCQEEYGIVDLEDHDLLSTPEIWTSFITGQTSDIHGIIGFKGQHLGSVEKFIKPIIQKFCGLKAISFASRIKSKIFPNSYSPFINDDIKVPTIFDKVSNSYALSVPIYNEPPIYTKIRSDIVEAVGNKELSKNVWDITQMECYKERKEFLKQLDNSFQLLMIHIFSSDVIGHLYWFDDMIIRGHYLDLNMFLGTIRNKCENSLILVVSDHGSLHGLHTPYGFYSSNIPLNLHKPKITDFYDVIMEALTWD